MWQGMTGYDMMYGYNGLFMMFFGILLIVGVILLAMWLFRQSSAGHTKEETALELLKKRYARGEIDKTEFEEKKKDLMV